MSTQIILLPHRRGFLNRQLEDPHLSPGGRRHNRRDRQETYPTFLCAPDAQALRSEPTKTNFCYGLAVFERKYMAGEIWSQSDAGDLA